MSHSERLQPLSAKQGTAELLACLTLVAPSGMSEEDRNAWVRVARETMKGIPADLLQRGCRKARETCRFASEIVPTILGEVKGEWNRRSRWAQEEAAFEENRNAPRLPSPEYVEAEEIRKLIKRIGR